VKSAFHWFAFSTMFEFSTVINSLLTAATNIAQFLITITKLTSTKAGVLTLFQHANCLWNEQV